MQKYNLPSIRMQVPFLMSCDLIIFLLFMLFSIKFAAQSYSFFLIKKDLDGSFRLKEQYKRWLIFFLEP